MLSSWVSTAAGGVASSEQGLKKACIVCFKPGLVRLDTPTDTIGTQACIWDDGNHQPRLTSLQQFFLGQ